MKVMMVIEGDDCALRIEPEDEEGRALLAAFGVVGPFETTLGSSEGSLKLSPAQLCASYEGIPAELEWEDVGRAR